MIQSSQIVDLSHDLFVNMPSYPTLPSFKIEYLKIAARDGSTVSLITSMHTHTGTHIDFPCHIVPDSNCLEHYSLQDLSGEGAVVDLSYKKEGEEITEKDLLRYGRHIRRGEMLFMFTGWSRKRALTPSYLFKWSHLSRRAAQLLVRKRPKVVGIDGLSIGGWGGKMVVGPIATTPSRTIHRMLLEAGILILEEIANLDKVLLRRKAARSFFILAPLPVRGAEASPCRVISIRSDL
jgi:kynurenine formamidase